jgi:site-specific DNA recombinase
MQARSDKAAADSKRAVIYLRVSGEKQVERGFGDEGFSIPGQREACLRKAAEQGATVVAEYVDLAKSAKTRNRPRFLEMVADVERDRNIDYVIVYKLNRFARKAMDDSVIDYRLEQAGAQLVSVQEHIDKTPAGKLNHRIHAAFAEYENENLAAEIRKGQIQKHQAGGTPYTAPIGYQHAQVEFEGRRISSIVIDEDRVHLVRLAFDLYDTGEYSITRLRDALEEHGLTTRPTRKRTSRPLPRASVHTMLRNSYYVGVVTYMGKQVQGRHPKLIDKAVFDRVQQRLDAQRAAGDRPRRHNHYLKGSLTCDQCGARLIYGKHRGRGGVYEYFSCVRRRARGGGTCDSGHYRVETVEIEVAALYWSLKLTKRRIEEIRAAVRAVAKEHVGVIQRAANRHRRRVLTLEDEQTKLLELHFKGGVSENVMRQQTSRIEAEERTLTQLLERSKIQLADIHDALEDALALTEKPLETYLTASSLARRMLNQIFFSEIRVGVDGEVQEADLQAPYRQIIAPRIHRRPAHDDTPATPSRSQTRPNPDPFSLGPRFDRDVNGAPEWTRTTTGKSPHKALNLIRPCNMGPPASRSSVLCGIADASDTSDEMTCAKDVPRPRCAKSPRGCSARLNAAQGSAPNICLGACSLGRTR